MVDNGIFGEMKVFTEEKVTLWLASGLVWFWGVEHEGIGDSAGGLGRGDS